MFRGLDQAIQNTFAELRGFGYGSHVHFDDALGSAWTDPTDARWMAVAREFAERAFHEEGRFIVSVPLGRTQQLPVDLTVASISTISQEEPPAIYYVADLWPQRTWIGEQYRRDLPESSERIMVYVTASRTLDELAEGEPFDVTLYFETRV
jgi:hypothetical protein